MKPHAWEHTQMQHVALGGRLITPCNHIMTEELGLARTLSSRYPFATPWVSRTHRARTEADPPTFRVRSSVTHELQNCGAARV